MGVSWLLDILSYLLRDYVAAHYLFYLTDFFNAILGFLIFILFIIKRRVFQLFQQR